MKKLFILLVSLAVISLFTVNAHLITPALQQNEITNYPNSPTLIQPSPLPKTKTLENDYHIFQSFNNCGPASLSMTLSYFGINVSQEELGESLRPFQVPFGDNDDKSVTLDELAKKATEYNLLSYHRPNGNLEILKQFIANDIPVLTRTWLNEDEDIGHYRVIKGYDDTTQQLIQDDSFQGKNLRYSYTTFTSLWEKFNYEYLVLVPKEKQQVAEKILGKDTDEKVAWKNAVELSKNQLEKDPKNIYHRFNLSVALYKTGDFQDAVTEYEKVANELPFRTLWYQREPILAYYEIGNYQKVFEISNAILNNQNRAYAELYFIRGEIYQKQQNKEKAKSEFEKAVYYNKNYSEAKKALDEV